MTEREKLETWLSSALDAVLVETGMKFKPAAEKRIARDLALAILASDWLREEIKRAYMAGFSDAQTPSPADGWERSVIRWEIDRPPASAEGQG